MLYVIVICPSKSLLGTLFLNSHVQSLSLITDVTFSSAVSILYVGNRNFVGKNLTVLLV